MRQFHTCLRPCATPLAGIFFFIFIILLGSLYYWTPPEFKLTKPDIVDLNSAHHPHHQSPEDQPRPSSTTPVTAPRPFSTTPVIAPKLTKKTDVGKLPALGWNTWNAYRCNITEAKILAAAENIISLGLKDAGYTYVNIDDCWSLFNRSTDGNLLVPDPGKFPNGIKGLADKIHRLGLKLGIYSDAGSLTCAKYPGSLGYEDLDAKTWEEWGVDYLKYDNCNIPEEWEDESDYSDWRNSKSYIRFERMGNALAGLTRSIEYSLCIWGTANAWEWGAEMGHSWRMGNDSTPDWPYLGEAIRHNANYLKSVDFWAHNDMDMMEIGNSKEQTLPLGLSFDEVKTHFAVWAFMKSPILLGTDLEKLSSKEIELVKNPRFLAFNQDEKYGRPALPYASPFNNAKLPARGIFTTEEPPVFFSGPSSKGVGIFAINWADRPENMTIVFNEVPELLDAGEPQAGEDGQTGFHYEVTDMWTGISRGKWKGTYAQKVEKHGTLAILVNRVGP